MKNDIVSETGSRTVIIIQRVLPHYRIAFFNQLSRRLLKHGILLKILYGLEFPGSVPCTVHPDEDWAVFIDNKYLFIGNTELVWQKCLSNIKHPDLVIIEQANRLLLNYILLFRWRFSDLRLAYWGHGRNLQALNVKSLKERLKRRLMNSVDWWFAYTKISANIIQETGYSQDKITVVNNSIDTKIFSEALNSVTSDQIDKLRLQLGIGEGQVALYCGGMYPDKQIPFLLQAAEELYNLKNDFKLVLIGSGPDEGLVKNKAKSNDWIHYIGPVYGAERAIYFSLCDVMLMPGPVGLVIVDSFIAALPLITTDIPTHGPEIAYLENGFNGIMTSFRIDDYVKIVSSCLSNDTYLNILRDGCTESACRYTLDSMVDNYSCGVLNCLAEPS